MLMAVWVLADTNQWIAPSFALGGVALAAFVGFITFALTRRAHDRDWLRDHRFEVYVETLAYWRRELSGAEKLAERPDAESKTRQQKRTWSRRGR